MFWYLDVSSRFIENLPRGAFVLVLKVEREKESLLLRNVGSLCIRLRVSFKFVDALSFPKECLISLQLFF